MAGNQKAITLNLFGRDVTLSRTLKKAGREADETAAKLRGLGKVGVITSGLAAIGPALNVVTASLVAAGGAAVMLPAVLTTAAVSFGVLALAVQGFGQAMKDIRDPKKFGEDMRKISPAARETAKEIRSLLPQLGNLRFSVQEGLFQGMAAEVRQLAGAYLPMLQTRLAAISAQMGASAGGLARWLGRPEQVRLVDQVLRQVAATVGFLGQAIRPAVQAFLQLAQIGGQFLPGLSARLAAAADRFAAFVQVGMQSGSIAGFLRDAGSAATALFGALRSVAQIFTGVLQAAAASGGLSTVGSSLAAIAAAVNTPAFQGALVAVFAGLSQAAASLSGVMPQVAAAFAVLAPHLGTLAAGIGAAVASALSFMAQAATELAPALGWVADTIAQLGPALGPLVVTIGAVTLAIKAWLVVVKLAAAIQTVIAVVRGWVVAQGALNVALTANPIGVVVMAIAALVAGIILAWKHSETFRTVVTSVFSAVGQVVLKVVGLILSGFQKLFEGASHLPGIGDQMRTVAQGFATAKGWVDATSASLSQLPKNVSTTYTIVTREVKHDPGHRGESYGGSGGYSTQPVTPRAPQVKIPKIAMGGGYSTGKAFGKGLGKAKDYINAHLTKVARSLAGRLTRAMDKLSAVTKARAGYIKRIRDSLLDATAITGFEKDPERRGTPGADHYIQFLADRLKKLRAYAADVKQLRRLGLNKATLRQILDAGMEGGADDASALAKGGKAAIGEVNKIQQKLGQTAGGLASGVGNQFYRSGVAAAKGLVRGLQSSRKHLLKVARGLAKGLRDAIRKELKIKSPSRALHSDGRNAGLGFLGGLASTRNGIDKAMTRLARPSGGESSFSGTAGSGRGQRPTVIHNHVHAGVVVDSSNVLRELDRMAKVAKSTGYRPRTLALQGA
jgi:phage-related protein